MLATKLLMEQGIEVVPIFFITNFCEPSLARQSAKQIGVSLREENISKEFISVLKKPKYGYGAGMNPCIDCHALMLKKAGEIMKKEKFNLVATGEVLGERPMSQNKKSLQIVEKEAGLEGYLLRPLSAKLLKPTIPELDGRVSREKLLDISGRSRQKQMVLAEKFGIKKYPTPAGGCALTQSGFAERLRELAVYKPNYDVYDLDLIKIGRHFWIDIKTLRLVPLRGSRSGNNPLLLPEQASHTKNGASASKAFVHIILGRNKEENEILETLAKKDSTIVRPEKIKAPTALIKKRRVSSAVFQKTKELIDKFSSGV